MIRRTMLFTVREDAAAAAVADLESLTRAAAGEIEGVTRIALGRNEAPGPWSHVWDMDVADVETVRRYGPSPLPHGRARAHFQSRLGQGLGE